MTYVTDQRELIHVVQVRVEYVVEVGRDLPPNSALVPEQVYDRAGGFPTYESAVDHGYELLDTFQGAQWFRVEKLYVRIANDEANDVGEDKR